MPRRPRSTLFPYTTLFRSAEQRGRHGQREPSAVAGECQRDRAADRQPERGGAVAVLLVRVGPQALGEERRGEDQDRKSTRLNSSHSSISYAVLCLKKKK